MCICCVLQHHWEFINVFGSAASVNLRFQIYEDNLHNISLASTPNIRTASIPESPPEKLIDIDTDEWVQ